MFAKALDTVRGPTPTPSAVKLGRCRELAMRDIHLRRPIDCVTFGVCSTRRLLNFFRGPWGLVLGSPTSAGRAQVETTPLRHLRGGPPRGQTKSIKRRRGEIIRGQSEQAKVLFLFHMALLSPLQPPFSSVQVSSNTTFGGGIFQVQPCGFCLGLCQLDAGDRPDTSGCDLEDTRKTPTQCKAATNDYA